MKRIYILALLSLLTVSCKEDEIDVFDINNSAVVFKTASVQYSMKGVTEESVSKILTLDLVGCVADYDRRIDLRVLKDAENTAEQGVDFVVGDAVMKAGEYVAQVELLIHQLPEGVETQKVTLEIVPNEFFRKGYPALTTTVVSWSEEYVRPAEPTVWKAWFNFLCKGYSKDYHKLLVDLFGVEIEYYTNSTLAAKNDETLIFKLPDWWYSANSQLREYVKKYDSEHPGEPLMHSNDYESYKNASDPVGSGTKPERVPTIFETLNQI